MRCHVPPTTTLRRMQVADAPGGPHPGPGRESPAVGRGPGFRMSLVSLAVLALLDSTSVGTLFVPIVLMLAPNRPRVMPILWY
jgi:hypothetical protein